MNNVDERAKYFAKYILSWIFGGLIIISLFIVLYRRRQRSNTKSPILNQILIEDNPIQYTGYTGHTSVQKS